VIVNHSTNIIKTNNDLSSQVVEHKKDHVVWHWKFSVWLW